ncbi:polyribonucleotide nucleotidyltransferase 2, mitochondrial isoform X2 [Selaginella moellendorffii]|nr:polyribonucleotide nucleotidyltransferase 2, mitochondrial isoform X2 [Selaginella moellendorffii]|eukprot:XP_002976027.2 polyribonucleotide nucleotidyltransferase 2, mitochondrial isoform X2 [Selaginella moellendorffii]
MKGSWRAGAAVRHRIASYVCPQLQIQSAPSPTRWRRHIATSRSARQQILSETSAPWRESAAKMQVFEESVMIGPELLTFETGKLAQFAAGAVVCGAGETKVLVTVVSDERLDAGRDFMPLQVEYREKSYAQGKIPNTFMRREGAPKERELLCGRVIDRSIRPLFPKGYYFETQIMANVLCSDGEQDPDILAANAASAALALSDVPWNGPIGVVRIGRVDGKFVVNPDMDTLSGSDLNLIYSCTAERSLMIETQAREITNKDFTAALKLAHSEASKLIEPQRRLAAKVGNRKRPVQVVKVDVPVLEKIRGLSEEHIKAVVNNPTLGKFERGKALGKAMENVQDILKKENDEAALSRFSLGFDTVKKQIVRENVFQKNIRVDGRSLTDVRDLYCEAGIYPALHGSSLFSRGNTQVLCTVTLGAPEDAQKLDSIVGPPKKRFMVHYSFPPFSVNEVGKVGGLNRREVGHGTLAEKALVALLPPEDENFPYSVRVNSEVMASDGSSSMATVCGGSLALMDAGIPLKSHVAGISVGLMTNVDAETGEIKNYKILTDILGLEDHLGDMDFKIAGTKKGVTAIQLDIKLPGVPLHILCEALEPAYVARKKILDLMEKEISKPRDTQRQDTPRRGTIVIQRESIGRLIGPSGSNIRHLQSVSGARLTVGEDGNVHIISRSEKSFKVAKSMIEALVGREIIVGETYTGTVSAIKDFGAFIDFDGGQQGLLHISEISHEPVTAIADVLSVGQQITVLCTGRDFRGNLKFSRKAVINKANAEATTTIPVLAKVTQAITQAKKSSQTFDLTAERITAVLTAGKTQLQQSGVEKRQSEDSPSMSEEKKISSKASPKKLAKPGAEKQEKEKTKKDEPKILMVMKVLHGGSSKKTASDAGAEKQEKEQTKRRQKQKVDGAGHEQKHEKACTEKQTTAEIGAIYHVTIEQIRKSGVAVKMETGASGVLKTGKGASTSDYSVGDKLKVKCVSIAPKGRPSFELTKLVL